MANTPICVHTRRGCTETRAGGGDADNNRKSLVSSARRVSESELLWHPRSSAAAAPVSRLSLIYWGLLPLRPPPLISFVLWFTTCDASSRNPGCPSPLSQRMLRIETRGWQDRSVAGGRGAAGDASTELSLWNKLFKDEVWVGERGISC